MGGGDWDVEWSLDGGAAEAVGVTPPRPSKGSKSTRNFGGTPLGKEDFMSCICLAKSSCTRCTLGFSLTCKINKANDTSLITYARRYTAKGH